MKKREKTTKSPAPLWIKWLLAAVPAALGALMYIALPRFPRFTEYAIARGLFRVVAFPLEWVVSLVPFSLAETALVLGVPALLALVIFWIWKIIKSEKRLKILEKGCRIVAWSLSLILFMYMLMHGANFSRLSTGELLDLPNGTYTAQDL